MRNSSSLDWLRFMHTPNDYRVSPDQFENLGDLIQGNHILKIDSFLHVFDSFHHRGHGGHRGEFVL